MELNPATTPPRYLASLVVQQAAEATAQVVAARAAPKTSRTAEEVLDVLAGRVDETLSAHELAERAARRAKEDEWQRCVGLVLGAIRDFERLYPGAPLPKTSALSSAERAPARCLVRFARERCPSLPRERFDEVVVALVSGGRLTAFYADRWADTSTCVPLQGKGYIERIARVG